MFLAFDSNWLELLFDGPIYKNITSGNSLALNMWQAIKWTKAGSVSGVAMLQWANVT